VRFVAVIRACFDGDAYAFLPALLAVAHLKTKKIKTDFHFEFGARVECSSLLILGMMVGRMEGE
jgi:hypothetical protein